MIKIAVYDPHPLLRQSVANQLDGADEEFTAIGIPTEGALAVGMVKTEGVNVIVVIVHSGDTQWEAFVKQLCQQFERLRCIVWLMTAEAQMVTRAIKAGAKGVVSPEVAMTEMRQAILTIRGGYEYFSKAITDILVDKYVDGVVTEEEKNGDKQPDIDLLSARQIEILKLWGNNLSNKDIADKLFLSVRTVESHKNHIMQKLNLKTAVDLIRFGIRNNIIEP